MVNNKSPSRRYILWNQDINYSVQKRLSVKPFLNRLTPVHTLTLYLVKIYFMERYTIAISVTQCPLFSDPILLCGESPHHTPSVQF